MQVPPPLPHQNACCCSGRGEGGSHTNQDVPSTRIGAAGSGQGGAPTEKKGPFYTQICDIEYVTKFDHNDTHTAHSRQSFEMQIVQSGDTYLSTEVNCRLVTN